MTFELYNDWIMTMHLYVELVGELAVLNDFNTAVMLIDVNC